MLGNPQTLYSIKAVENALMILEAIGDIDGDVRITQLCETVGMHKSYIFRVLATFEKLGYIEKGDKSGKYRLGLTAFELGQKFLSRLEIVNRARPIMEQVAGECDEAVYLTLPRDREVHMLHRVDTKQMVNTVSLVGNSYPLEQTAAGKVILAFEEGKAGSMMIPSSLAEEMNSIQNRGAAVDFGGLGADIACLAVPLFGMRGRICGSLSIVGPEFRMGRDRIEKDLLPKLKNAGGELSTKLGYGQCGQWQLR